VNWLIACLVVVRVARFRVTPPRALIMRTGARPLAFASGLASFSFAGYIVVAILVRSQLCGG
jgi:hypothetical protein